MLDGWGQIATALSEAAGVNISVDQAKRYELEHGLPVQRKGPGKRKRVVAELEAVVSWCIKAFG